MSSPSWRRLRPRRGNLLLRPLPWRRGPGLELPPPHRGGLLHPADRRGGGPVTRGASGGAAVGHVPAAGGLGGVADADDALRPDHWRLVPRARADDKVPLVLVQVVERVPRTKVGVFVLVLIGGGVLRRKYNAWKLMCATEKGACLPHQFEMLWYPVRAKRFPLPGSRPLRLLKLGLLLRRSGLVILVDGLGHHLPQADRLESALKRNKWFV